MAWSISKSSTTWPCKHCAIISTVQLIDETALVCSMLIYHLTLFFVLFWNCRKYGFWFFFSWESCSLEDSFHFFNAASPFFNGRARDLLFKVISHIYANLTTLYALMKVNSYGSQRYFYLSSVFSEAGCVMAQQILLFSLLPSLPSQGVPGFLVADTFEKQQCILQRVFSHEKIQDCST